MICGCVLCVAMFELCPGERVFWRRPHPHHHRGGRSLQTSLQEKLTGKLIKDVSIYRYLDKKFEIQQLNNSYWVLNYKPPLIFPFSYLIQIRFLPLDVWVWCNKWKYVFDAINKLNTYLLSTLSMTSFHNSHYTSRLYFKMYDISSHLDIYSWGGPACAQSGGDFNFTGRRAT